MSKKWYNFFVSVDQGAEQNTPNPAAPAQAGSDDGSAKLVADIAATLGPAPQFAAPAGEAPSFEEIYRAADINPPAHGYTVLKVAQMLQSAHIRGLPPEVRRSSILVALDAAGVKVEEIIQDAVSRDRALDTYERVLQKSAEELEARKLEENRQIEAELERIVAEHRARIQANSDAIAKEKDRFYGWRLQKQQEEKKIADAVAYFASENPITTNGAAAAPSPAPKPQGS